MQRDRFYENQTFSIHPSMLMHISYVRTLFSYTLSNSEMTHIRIFPPQWLELCPVLNRRQGSFISLNQLCLLLLTTKKSVVFYIKKMPTISLVQKFTETRAKEITWHVKESKKLNSISLITKLPSEYHTKFPTTNNLFTHTHLFRRKK